MTANRGVQGAQHRTPLIHRFSVASVRQPCWRLVRVIQPLTPLLAAPRRPESPKKKEKAKRSRTYAPATFRCHFEERSFEPREHSGLPVGERRSDACSKELEAMPRLVWPQEASELRGTVGAQTQVMQTQVMISPRKKTCRSARVWCFWRFHTTNPKDETTDTDGSQGVRVYQKS